MIKKLIKIFQDLSCQDICINLAEHSPDIFKATFQAKQLVLNKDPEAILEIEKLVVLLPSESLSTQKETFLNVEEFSLKVSQGFLNICLDILSAQIEEIIKLRVIISDEKVKIKGSYRKVISWPFEINLKIELTENILTIRWEDFLAIGIIPLPQKVRELILEVIKNNLDIPCVEFKKDQIEIDINKIEGLKVNLKELSLDKGYIDLSS